MSIKNWSKGERPIDRALDVGVRALSNAELLAILIGSGTKGRSAVDVAREFIASNGSLQRAMLAVADDRGVDGGLGNVARARILSGIEIARRIVEQSDVLGGALTEPCEVARFLKYHYALCQREVVTVVLLDSRNKVKGVHDVSVGTVDQAQIHPREIVRLALREQAVSVILAHNHPSGNAQPSAADEQITQRIAKSLQMVDISLLDHLVIGDNSYTSFAESGLI